MPKKTTKPGKALATIASATRETHHALVGSSDVVRVDAVFRVPTVHPTQIGPWSAEADKISWTDAATGYDCIIRRSPVGKHLCGYVSVPPAHPLFGRRTESLGDHLVGVHGGLDYAAACQAREPEPVSICHPSGGKGLPRGARSSGQNVYENDVAGGHDDAWWFGFSCNHLGDVKPEADYKRHNDQARLAGVADPVYRTEAFVYRECLRLAVQLKAIAQGRDPRDADPGPVSTVHDPYRNRM